MKEEKNTKGISRRDFIRKSGTGVAGSYLILSNLDEVSAKEMPAQEIVKTYSANAREISLKVNGRDYKVKVEPETTLVELLREEFKLTGTKVVCNHGECGGCTVVINKKAVYSCQMLALDVEGKEVTTIEGLLDGEKAHPIQEAFIEKDGMQCGFCTPGQIMAAYALLLNNPKASLNEIKKEMSGNICRCSTYPNIVKSVEEAARRMNS